MPNTCTFSMKIMGEEQAIRDFTQAIRRKETPFTEIVSFELKEDTRERFGEEPVLISVQGTGACCASVKEALLDRALVDFCKEKDLVLEIYSTVPNQHLQEHYVMNRGVMLSSDTRSYKDYTLDDLKGETLSTLAFEYGAETEEILEHATENGFFRDGGFEDAYEAFHNLFWISPPDPELESKFISFPSIYNDEIYSVLPYISSYVDSNNLFVGLYYRDKDSLSLEPFGDVTVNISRLPYLYSTIDTNNMGNGILDFLEKNGFGVKTDMTLPSGWCNYPVFQFDPDKLQEIDSEVFAEYAASHGVQLASKKVPLADKIEEATSRAETFSQDQLDVKQDLDRE